MVILWRKCFNLILSTTMNEPAPILPDLPDHIWLIILGYIDDSLLLSDLHYSASVPTVIRRVAGDFQLWKSVRVVNPLNRGRLRKIVPFLGEHTREDACPSFPDNI